MTADMTTTNLRIRLYDAVGGDPDVAQAVWEIVSPVVAERDALKAEVDQIRYERRLLGWARMTLDLVAAGDHTRWEQARREAEDIAQRIVDEIGHPVTDEPALGPGIRAAIERTLEAMERYTAAGCTTVNVRQVVNLLSPTYPDGNYEAALDASTAPESACPRCEGSMIEPGSEDYDPAVHMHNPTTGEPCSACNGTGKATGWLDQVAAASLAAARSKFEGKMRPVSVESPGNDGFRYEAENPEETNE